MNLTTESKKKILAIIAGTIVVCILLAAVTTPGCMGEAQMEEKTQRIEAAGVKSLSIDFPVGKMKVHEAEQGERNVVITERASGNLTRKAQMACDVEDGTLRVRFKMNPLAWLPFNWFGSGNRELDIAVPAEILSSLDGFELHCSAGKSEVESLRCKAANVSVSAGDVVLNGLDVEDHSELKLSAGSLRITDARLGTCKLEESAGKVDLSGDMRSLSLKTSAGQAVVECTNSDVSQIDVGLSAGDVELILPNDAGFDAAVDKTAGSFNCLFDAEIRGETYRHADGDIPIDIHITAGSVTLRPI
ncbi:MAG: DUF4097 domain-containing protein [Eggerthellaceae bacterium]|nr:DUF4097 domain-containing protein [Eggerthellaceae bacterium]